MSHDSQPGPPLVVGAAVLDDPLAPTRVLAARRTAPPALAGRWELPGGKVEPGEEPEQALHRELAEELGVAVLLLGPVRRPGGGDWPLGRGPTDRRLRVWLAVVTAGEPTPLQDHDALLWIALDDVAAVAWLDADLPVVEQVARQVAPPRGTGDDRAGRSRQG